MTGDAATGSGPERPRAAAAGPPVADMSYTDASAELDEIVRFFEQREVDVDLLVDRLVRATAIVEELDRRLRRTRVQVDQLVPRLAAVLQETAEGARGDAGEHTGEAGEPAGDPLDAPPDDEPPDDDPLDDEPPDNDPLDDEPDGDPPGDVSAPGLF